MFRERRDEAIYGKPSALEILKECYPKGASRQRPAWARLARERGWMTAARYYSLEPTEPAGPGALDVLYAKFSLFRMLKRDVVFKAPGEE